MIGRVRQPKSKIFIGSSRERINLANALCSHFEHEKKWTAVTWTNAHFFLTSATLDSLENILTDYEYGVFVFAPDDALDKRKELLPVARDNVLFELGLFLGRQNGRKRAFIVRPRDVEMHFPTDLKGITAAEYDIPENPGTMAEVKQAMAFAAEAIKDAINRYEEDQRVKAGRYVRLEIGRTRERLRELSDERRKVQVVIDSLYNVLNSHAVATEQTVHGTLEDVLLWAGSLLDVYDVDQLAQFQTTELKEIWVYAPVPLEFVHDSLRARVRRNLLSDVKYKYFVEDSDGVGRINELVKAMAKEYQGRAKNVLQRMKERIEVVVLRPEYFLTCYTIHHLRGGEKHVLQSVVREDRNDLITRLSANQAENIVLRIEGLLGQTKKDRQNEITVYRLIS